MSEEAGKNLMAHDLGYSSSKSAYLTLGPNEKPGEAISRIEVEHCPGGVQEFGLSDATVGRKEKTAKVVVDDKLYVAGVDHKTVGHDRQRSEHFIYQPEWMARFKAAVKRSGFSNKTIDTLVLGLPCDMYYNHANPTEKSAQVKHLEEACSGTIDIDGEQTYEVKKVVVMAQPHGTYWGFFGKTKDNSLRNLARRGSILVMDVGYYTFDWINLDKLNVVLRNSNSRPNAFHQVLDNAAGSITADLREQGLTKAKVSPDDIEDALFNGETTVLVGSKEIEIDPYLYTASETVAAQVFKAIEGDVGQTPPSLILVSGGGAKHFAPHIERWAESMGTKVITPDSPERLNAFGYMTNALINHS
ncbi:ParM/StbA family protein [Halomonas sp. I5-271120]|uniref:ParM/StbA family protein n=1 Tax=Halomonas sp. I5-271120 TaxID=3061632 RepID=UPI002714C1C2|nr:ParM/StbA family protein [Halomonas sp. I5-271120]